MNSPLDPWPVAAARNDVQRHFPTLDGLRGLAILLVIPHNADVFGPVSGLLWPAALLAHAGWVGVQLFFVLSGFLITSNLLDTQQAGNYYQSFFARRTLRIFPLYYGTLFVALIVVPHFVALAPEVAATHVHQVWLWTFLVNWAEPFGKAVHGFPHFWSLSVEEQFYLVWPFLVHRRSPRSVWTLCTTLIIAALLIRCAMLFAGARAEEIYMFTICRMDALAAGAAAAALIRMPAAVALLRRYSNKLWITGLVLGLVGAAITDTYALYGSGTFTIGYTLLSVCFALLLLGALAPSSRINAPYHAVLTFAPLRSVGKYSYGMYVFHMLIIMVIGPKILAPLRGLTSFYPVLYALVIAVLSYVAAVISYQCYEKHFLKLKRRFKPQTTQALQTVV
jgi:peptidoglycan/LPS O-acetylase OafA/YrhL